MLNSTRCESSKKGFSIDPKIMLLNELARQDREESARPDWIDGQPLNQKIGASDVYLVLDSSERNVDNSNPLKGVFAFDIVTAGTTGSSMIGISNELNNIIEIEVQSFPFPILPAYTIPANTTINNSMPILIPGPPPSILSQIYNNRFILQIQETSVQSISDVGGVRHNFAFDLLHINNQLYASPVAPVYVFTDPITSFGSLTLVFRNPPVTLSFLEDTMKSSRFSILQTLELTKADPVSIVIHIKLSDYTGYTYTSGAGTIVIEVSDTDINFTNPNATSNTFKYKNGVNLTDMAISTRFLLDNVEGDGANEANGVYSLTSLVDNGGGTHTYTFTRTTDLDQVSELVQYVSVNVTSGNYKGKIYYLNNIISALTEDQDWLDYNNTYLLHLYYQNHRLETDNRIKIQNLKQGQLPQKLYKYLTREEGLYVGTVFSTVPPIGTSPIDDTRNYFRLNPDISLGEFIVNSFTNNYIVKTVEEAKLYGFNVLKQGQLIIVPQSITKGISQLTLAITYNEVVDKSNPTAYIFSNWTQPPYDTEYGNSTMKNNNEYETLSTFYDTASVLSRLVTDDVRYIEIEYTGDTDNLSDLYLGIIKPFTSSLFKLPLVLTEGGADTMQWTHPNVQAFGTASIDAIGAYVTAETDYNTAAIINKKIFDGAFVVFEKSSGASSRMKTVFATIDQATYEAMDDMGAVNWARNYPEITANENIALRLHNATTIRKAFNGSGATDVTIPTVANLVVGDKVAVAIGAVNSTTINIGLKYIDGSNNNVLLDFVSQFTVANSGDWFDNTDRLFYLASDDTDDALKPIYTESFPTGLPTGFISVAQQVNVPLSMPWFTPINYKFGNGSVIDEVYNPTDKYDTAFIIDTPIVSNDWALYRQFGETSSLTTRAYFGFIDKNAYQSLLIDNGKDNWTKQQKITQNEGFLVSLGTDVDHQVPLTLIDKTPIELPTGYSNNNAILDQGIYSTLSTTYNTASVMYTLPKLNTKYSFMYQELNSLIPSAYFGMINKENFTSSLNALSPLFLTTQAGWNTPSDFQYGNAEIDSDGQYVATTMEGNTAAIIKNDDDIQELGTRIFYSGSNGVNPTIRFGYIEKEAYENNSKDINPLVLPFITTKDIWTLPSEFDNLLKAAPITNGKYKSNVAKYASAAIINESIQKGLQHIVYVGTNDRYPKAVFGYVNQAAYESLPAAAALDNWSNSLDVTDNEGVLIEILRPEDPRNTNGIRQQLLVKYNNTTTTNHTFNSDKILPKFDSGTVIMLGYQPSDATSIFIYVEIRAGNGDKLFATYDDLSGGNQIDLTVSDSTTWYANQKTYITVNNKVEKYVSDPTYPLSDFWAVAGRNTYKDGILFEIMDSNNPTNPILTNSSIRYIVNGKFNTIDLGLAMTFNNGGMILLTYAITNPTTITVTVVMVHSGGTEIETFIIENIIDSSTWIDNKNVYLVNYVPTFKWLVTKSSDWASKKEITDERGFLCRILKPSDPLNPYNPNSALEEIIDGAAPVYIDLGGAISDLTTDSAMTMMILDQGPTTKRITITVTNKSTLNTPTQLFTQNIDLTIADAGEYANWQNTVVPYITTNSPTESYKSDVAMNIRALFDNDEFYTTATSPLYDQIIIPQGGLGIHLVSFDATHIDITFARANASGVIIETFINRITVIDSATWYENKRFFITTDNPLEKYKSVNYVDWFPFGNLTDSVHVGGSTVRSINDEESVGGEDWTNRVEVTKNEGFLTQFDFSTGTGTGINNNTAGVSLATIMSLAGKKIDKGGYIQIGYERSTNDINYEIVFVNSLNVMQGHYTGALTTANGVTWLAEKTKRFYITTNNTKHTFKSTSNPHTYLGIISVPGFINTGDTKYKKYTTDITNIIPGKSFTLNGTTVNNVVNFIISLTGQEIPSLNRLYQLENLEDIKATGIRLSENYLIFPQAFPTIFCPERVFKIPFRFRRILRRITNMSGI